MRKISLSISLLVALSCAPSANAVLRVSNPVANNWNVAASWAGGVVPAATDTAEIVAGANITTSSSTTIAGVKVDAGGTLTLSSALTVNHGTSPDLDVFGTVSAIGGTSALTLGANATVVVESGGVLSYNGSSSTFVSAGAGSSITFANGGKYVMLRNGGQIPTATWAVGSTCEIDGFTSATTGPTGMGQAFWDFTWNCPGQGSASTVQLGLGGVTGFSVGGTFRVLSTGAAVNGVRFTSTLATLSIANILVSGGILQGTGTGGIGLTLNVSGNIVVTGGTLDLRAASGTGATGTTINMSSGNVTVSSPGIITLSGSGSGVINFTSAGTQTITQSGTISGANITWSVGSTTLLQPTTPLTIGGTVSVDGTLNLNGQAASFNALSGSATGTVKNDGAATTLTLGSGNGTGDFSGLLADGAGGYTLTKGGTGVATFRNPNSFTGKVFITGGRIDILSDGCIGAVPGSFVPDSITLDGGSLSSSNNFTLNANRGIKIGASGGTISPAQNPADSSSFVLTYNGVISGSLGGAFKHGRNGVLILGGANTYDGATWILSGGSSIGTLQLGASGVIPDASAVGVTNATFDVNGFIETIGSLGSDALALIKLGSGTLTCGGNNGSSTVLGAISGSGTLKKVGTGTMTLSGANTMSGQVSISGGTLAVAATSSLGTVNNVFVNSGTLSLGGNANLAAVTTLNISGGTTVNLGYSGTDNINALYINGILQPAGTWGAPGSGAAHTSSLFTGTGILNAGTGAAAITLTCSTNITVTATSGAGAVVNYTSSASGGCTPPVVNCTPPSGSLFPIGTNIVSCNATDSCGQVANCSFTITVKPVTSAEYFAAQNLLPPPPAVYISPAFWHVLFANGIVIRDIAHRKFTQSLPPPPLGNSQPHSFGSELDFEVSFDNGATFTPGSGLANVTVQVTHSSDSGGTSYFDTEMTQLDLSGPGFLLRESPTLQSLGQTTVRPVPGGYMISSFFDVNVEVSTDGGVTWQPGNAPGHVELRNDPANVPAVGEPTRLLPPPVSGYVSPQLWHALFAQGIVLKDVSHKFFTASLDLPTSGGSNYHSFNSIVDVSISTDGGNTFQDVRVNAPVQVSVVGIGSGNSGLYDTEMTSLTLSGLPGGLMIRESPSLPSRGGTLVTPQPDGSVRIGSFFDIFPEISTDGGASWSGATNGPVRMQLTDLAPEVPKPNPNLPPLDGNYISPAKWHALYASGIIITNASHDRFTQTQLPPPPGGNQTENFGSQVHGLISMDGGATFQPFSAPASVAVQVNSRSDLDRGPTRFFETEILQLDLSGGSLPPGVMIRESPTRASLGRTSVRTTASDYRIGSFFDVFTEVSTDGGATWSPSVTAPGTMGLAPTPTNTPTLTVTCPSNITVYATSPAGAVVTFSPTTSGGCPPVNVVANPPSGSTFPVGTTTVTVTASDGCGQQAQCTFTVTVKPPVNEYFEPLPLLPPPNSVYISPALWHVLYNNGIVIRDIRHRFFTQHFPPPPLGVTDVHSFGSELDYEISFDNGATFTPGTGSAQVTVQITHSHDAGGTSYYDTEMLQLDLTGSGFMLRESPTRASTGQTTVRPVAGGYLMSSFFDVFTEISTDNGVTWTITPNAGHVELRNDPETASPASHPTDLLPSPVGEYVSPQQWHALFAQGIVISNISHKFFTDSQHPPATGSNTTHTFNSTLDMSISTDGGVSFQSVRVSAPVTVSLAAQGSGSSGFYDTEMLQLDVSGLPGGLMIRESPTLPSRGGTTLKLNQLPPGDPDVGTFRIGSFFDIFTELSTDGGASWSGATNGPVRMQLKPAVPEVPKPSPNLPPLDGNYISPAKWHALYANGIIITNASHDRFTQTQPPPPPGGSQTENFGSQLHGLISMNGGASFQPFSAPASVAVMVSSHSSLDTGPTRFFDTEMLALSLSGGTLPGGVMIRESPTRASLGRTSVRTTSSDYRIGSFFDVFTEVSTDGGATWSPSLTGPGTMGLTPSNSTIAVICSSNITVAAASCTNGAVVFFNSSISNGCAAGPGTVSCNPPSGSFFPIGTTTVTCTGCDACGVCDTCSFTVTVTPATCPPIVLTCSSNIVVTSTNCGNAGMTIFYSSSASGGCTNPTVVCNPPSGSTFPVGTTTVTCTASDGCNTTNCSFTVTVNPCPAVILTCSSNIVVNATNCGPGAGANVFFSSSATGGCGPLSVSCNPPSGSFFPIGTTTVTCTAFNCGIVSTNCSFTVTVNPPACAPLVLTCSSNIVVNSTNCGSAGAVVFYNSSATGGCAPTTVNCNPPSGSTFPIGTTVVTCTASDGCGNHTNCSFSVTVNPCPPVVLTCSSNIIVNATNCGTGAGANVFYASSVSGGCGPASFSCNPPSGSFFPIGTTTVTCTAFDCGVVATNCSFTVTVKPPQCPAIVLTCSSNIVVNSTNCGSGGVVFYNSSATGGCGPTTVSCNPPSGSTFPVGTTIVTCTASDSCGNHTNCSFNVTVNPCPPIVLTCSSNITVTTASCNSNSAVVFYSSSASGGCNPPPSLFCTPPSGSSFPVGTTTVTCTASNSCGQVTNCSFTVTVNQAAPPPIVLTCSSNISVTTSCNSNSAVVFYTSTASGGCNPPPSLFCTPPSGSTFPVGTTTVTCTATNSSGQTTNCSFTVTVNQAAPPPIVLTCSSNITVTSSNCGSAGVVVFYSSTASGGCNPPPSLFCTPPSGSTFPVGTTTVTCTATNSSGQSTNCSFTVTVNPCPPVVLTCSSNIVVTTTNCASTGATVFYSSSVSGGCGATVSCNPPSGSFFPIGTTTVTCSAFNCGVVVTNCSFTVTVKPPTCGPIVVNCSSNLVVQTAGCIASNATVFYNSSATGGCPALTLSCNPPSGSSFPPGVTTVTCSATDSCGNSNVCSFTVTVTNGGPCPPIVLTCSSNITINANSCTGSVPVFFSSSATGGCGTATVTCNPPSGSSFPVNASTLVTCTATDSCGHTTNCTFAVTVNPPQCPPIVLTCSSNITINANSCTGSVPVFFSSSATGGCGPTTVSCSPPSGSSFPVNTSTLVTCTATDSCGHTTNCTFAVTVNPPHCPPIVLNCPKKIKVVTHKHFGAFVTWTSTASGGCPPTTVSCSPPSGSFFPVGTTLVTCTACDSCGHCTNCSFTVTVIPQHFVTVNLLPVTNTVYISPATWHALYANGVVIRDVRHRFFTTGTLPPPIGTTQIHTFDSQLDFELSTDNGNTFQQVSAPATTTVSVTHSSDDEGIESYDTEMLSLDVQGLPPGIRLRESPTLQSLGQTSIEPTPGGYMVSSFFDVFTEISLDNGATWTPADDSASVEMRNDPRAVSPGTVPSQLLPPPNGAYVSPQQWHALYAQGIVIKDVKHKFFTQSLQPPPAAGSNTESFSSTLDMQVSTDGGQTFQYVRAAAPVRVTVASVGSGNSGMYETEMTQLDLTVQAGGQTLKIRESPTLPSRGGTQIDSQPDGSFRINSFFDIFPELSLDGGNTWAPTTNGPVRMEFTPQNIEVPASTPNLPVTNAPYISPAQWHALYANGIIITNVAHRGFLQTQPPPPPGSNQLETFNSIVDGQVSTDGGHTFTPFSATANAIVQVNSRSDQDSGSTRFFDTEMLSLDVQGLPNGMRLRESPTKVSLGRTSIRTTADGYRIGSFFDIFTEISLDNGNTWSPSTTAPATMTPRLPARKRYFPQPSLPPTNGQYISPKQWHALYANGVIVSNVTHRRFLDNFPPPPKNATNTHNFNSQVNFLLKMPGQPFMPMTANANCTVSVGSSGFQSREQVYQTEMLALNLSGGSLPPGVMIRESPTRRSLGETHYSGGGGGGYRIGSFFDIFTEISLDNGNTWSPASSAGSMELHIDPGVPPTTIVKPRINAGVPTFTVQSQLGLQYLLQYKNDLNDATWTTISITKGNGAELDLIDCCPPPGPSRPHRFYEVQVQEDDTY